MTTATQNDPIYGRPEYSPYTAPLMQPMQPLPQQHMLPPIPPRPAATPVSGISPGLAFILGWIPGVGAIYNGQYAKGMVHVVIFGMIVSALSRGVGGFEPLFGMGLAAFFFYMAFEAYHTAKRRTLGIAVDEFSSLMHFDHNNGRVPLGPVLLIALGTLFLLANFDLIRIDQILRFWPLGLIGFGLYLLMGRMNSQRP